MRVVECGGPRVSEQQSAALRREYWRALNLFSVLGKALPERNLGFPGLREGRRTRPSTAGVGSFFLSFFRTIFGRPFFRSLVIFSPSGNLFIENH